MITLPFPTFPFKLDCGTLPEVRQWLTDNGVTWKATRSPSPFHLWPNIDHLFITDKKMVCTLSLTFFNNNPNQLITKDQLFSLSVESATAEFFKYFNKLDEAKDCIAKHHPIDDTLIRTLNIEPSTWKIFCDKYNLCHKLFNTEKFLSIN